MNEISDQGVMDTRSLTVRMVVTYRRLWQVFVRIPGVRLFSLRQLDHDGG